MDKSPKPPNLVKKDDEAELIVFEWRDQIKIVLRRFSPLNWPYIIVLLALIVALAAIWKI